MAEALAGLGLAVSTLVSEDLTTIGAALLARDGRITPKTALLGCAAGIYLGDLGLWLLGRTLGRRALALPWVARALDAGGLIRLRTALEHNLGLAVVGSRFLPGSRLPLYVAAGIWGRRPWAFAAWSAVAVMVWTPLLMLVAIGLGDALVLPALRGFGHLVSGAVAGGIAYAVLRGGLAAAADASRRAIWPARTSRSLIP